MDTVDPERGNCLMLFENKMDILNMMPENDQCDTFILLKRWFEGADENAVMQEAQKHPHSHQVATALRILIGEQRRNANKYVEHCQKQQRRKMKKEEPNSDARGYQARQGRPAGEDGANGGQPW